MRQDDVEMSLNERVTRLGQRVDRAETRLDDHDQKFQVTEARLDDHDARLDEAFESMGRGFETVNERVLSLKRVVDRSSHERLALLFVASCCLLAWILL